MKKIVQLLRQPYPYLYNWRSLHLIAVVCFAAAFLFLWFFKPFHVNEEEHKLNYILICLLHAGFPALIFYLYFLLHSLITSDIEKERWTVGKEILWLTVLFVLCGVESFLVRDLIYTNPDNWSWKYFFEEIQNTVLAGFLLTSMLTFLNFKRMLHKHQHQAKKIEIQHTEQKEQPEQSIYIKTSTPTEDFRLNLHQLLFVRSDKNYLEIFVWENSGVNKLLKRMTMMQFEDQVKDHSFLFRCHRAFLVNTRHIVNVSGNAQGYLLELSMISEKVPVSRSKIPAFEQLGLQHLIG